MLTDIEAAALELALELEDAIKTGLVPPPPITLALSHLRTAQAARPGHTQTELEKFYRVYLNHRDDKPSNIIYLNQMRLRATTNTEDDNVS